MLIKENQSCTFSSHLLNFYIRTFIKPSATLPFAVVVAGESALTPAG